MKIHPEFHFNGKPVSTVSQLQVNLAKFKNLHLNFLQSWFNDKAYIIARTSGSTGQPKAIKINKENLLNSAYKTIDFFGLMPGTKALLNLSSEFIAGKLMWIRALTGGWHLDVCLPEHKSIKKMLFNNLYDFGAMVPLQVYQNLEYIYRIKQLIIGGGVVSSDLQQKLYDLPNRILCNHTE